MYKGERHLRICTLIFTCMVLFAGCAGGGSPQSVVPSPPPSQPTPPEPVPPPEPEEPVLPLLMSSPPTDMTGSDEDIASFYYDYFADSIAAVELRQINVHKAYANIHASRGMNAATRPGRGATIGFIDTGLDTGHPAFATGADDREINLHLFGRAANEPWRSRSGTKVDLGHGTITASIAAGVRPDDRWSYRGNNVTSEGVAPGANISMFAMLGETTDVFVEAIEAAVEDTDIDVINFSFGQGRAIVSDSYYDDLAFTPSGSLTGPGFLEDIGRVYGALANSAGEQVIVVAAGNQYGRPCLPDPSRESCQRNPDYDPEIEDSENEYLINASSPQAPAGLTYLVEGIRPFWTAVVAVQPPDDDGNPGEIASFSNRCGVAAEWCIAAPGVRIGVAYSDRDRNVPPNITRVVGKTDGTSLAAPMVSGGLALMKQQFRGNLSGPQLLTRLYATANKEGIYSNASVYGQGLIDLGAATSPVEDVGVPETTGVVISSDTDLSSLSSARVETAEAFGDGLARSLSGKEIAGFDKLGAPFWYPLDSFVPKAYAPALGRQLDGFMDFVSEPSPRELGERSPAPLLADGPGTEGEGGIPTVYFHAGASEMEDPEGLGKKGHMSFVRSPRFAVVESDSFSAHAFSSSEGVETHRSAGAVLSYNPPELPFGLRTGYISEYDSALGTTAEGAFGGLSARVAFLNIGWNWNLGLWRAVADAEIGTSYPDSDGGLISGMSRLTTSSFSAGLIREFAGGLALKVSVSSPLRVESGTMELLIPAGRTPAGEIVRDRFSAGVEPSGRQIDVGAQLVARTHLGSLSLGGIVSREPGHNSAAGPSVSVLAGYGTNF